MAPDSAGGTGPGLSTPAFYAVPRRDGEEGATEMAGGRISRVHVPSHSTLTPPRKGVEGRWRRFLWTELQILA